MPMKNPPHPGELIGGVVYPLGGINPLLNL
jgi:hypothetical protein